MTRAQAQPPFRTHVAITLVVLVAIVVAAKDALTAYSLLVGRYLFTSGGADPLLPLSDVPQLSQAELQSHHTGHLVDAALSTRLWCSVPSVVGGVTFIVAAAILIKVLRQISRGAPFESSTLRRWTRLALTLVIGGIVQGLADSWAVYFIYHRVFGDPDGQDKLFGAQYQGIGIGGPDWPIAVILAGVVAYALTTAFRAGARLKEEAAGVV